jgi:hypothetical protein
MNMLWVAYNDWGDMVASADNENDLLHCLALQGIDEDEVRIGRLTA